MNPLELQNQVAQKIHEFEMAEALATSKDWDLNLYKKLNASTPSSNSSYLKYGLIMVVFIVLNAGFIWNVIINESPKEAVRTTELTMLYSELLLTSND